MFKYGRGESSVRRPSMWDMPWRCAGSALTLALALTGCGAEVAVGAAATGSMQAEQAKQAVAQQAQAVERLKAAQEAAAARSASAADAAGQ